MSYLDRLRDLRYITPGGTTFTLQSSAVGRSMEKKAAIHELPQQDTPEVQELGNKAHRLSVSCYISGADYDLTADAFAKGLSEHGRGTLVHPRWGDILVLPLTVNQSESFVEGMGRATFEIEFLRLADSLFPTAFPVSTRSIESKLAGPTPDSATAAFSDSFAPTAAADLAACKKAVTGGASDLFENLKAQIAFDSDISSQVNAQVTLITTTIDTLMTNPQNLAESVLTLCGLPANVDTAISSKIKGYSAAIGNIILKIPQTIAQSAIAFLQLFGLSSGVVQSTLTGDLTDRADAVTAAQAVQDVMTAVQGGAEGTEASGYFVPADVLAQIRDMMAAAAALLLEKAFSLRTSRKITLTSDRTPLDLIYELKKPADGAALETALGEFIAQNKLAGEALLMIPAGTEVAYYA